MTSAADQNANVIFGAVINDSLKDEVRVTVIATGFGATRRRRARQPVAAEPLRRDRESDPFELGSDTLDVPSFLRDE